jgi:hypothetical protein
MEATEATTNTPTITDPPSCSRCGADPFEGDVDGALEVRRPDGKEGNWLTTPALAAYSLVGDAVPFGAFRAALVSAWEWSQETAENEDPDEPDTLCLDCTIHAFVCGCADNAEHEWQDLMKGAGTAPEAPATAPRYRARHARRVGYRWVTQSAVTAGVLAGAGVWLVLRHRLADHGDDPSSPDGDQPVAPEPPPVLRQQAS